MIIYLLDLISKRRRRVFLLAPVEFCVHVFELLLGDDFHDSVRIGENVASFRHGDAAPIGVLVDFVDNSVHVFDFGE